MTDRRPQRRRRGRPGGLRAGERSTTTTLGYTLTLAISTLLVTGLIVTGSNFVQDQREIVVENELEVVGEQVAGQLEQADRLLAASSDPQAVRINESAPETVSGATYDVILEPGSPAELELRTRNPDVTVTLEVGLTSDVVDSSAGGGTVVVRCSSSNCSPKELVIDNE